MKRRKPLKRSVKPIARRTRPRKQRKGKLGAAKRTLWNYFARYVKDRDGNECFTCDRWAEGSSLHAGHLFTRARGSMLYEPKAVHSQCAACNRGRRGNIPEYTLRFIDKYGVEEFQRLARRATQEKHWTEPEVRELIEALRVGGAEFEMLYAEKHGL